MEFFRNQRGFTFLEIMIAVGLMAIVALGFMTYQTNLLKTESDTKIRHAMNELETILAQQFEENKSCKSNITEAFKDLNISTAPGAEVLGKPDSAIVASGAIGKVQIFNSIWIPVLLDPRPVIFKGMYLARDKIFIEDVVYKLTNIRTLHRGVHFQPPMPWMPTVPLPTWSHEANLEISINYSHCLVAGPMRRELASVCQNNKVVKTKTYNKLIRFTMDSGRIKKNTYKIGTYSNAEVLDVSCQISLSDAERKACFLEAQMLAASGYEGRTECEYTIQTRPDSFPFVKPVSVLEMPKGIVPGSLQLSMVGGGGGGGSGVNRRPGKGGFAGSGRQNIVIPDQAKDWQCLFYPGKGGEISLAGEASRVQCTKNGFIKFSITAPGGGGGDDGAWDEDSAVGTNGTNSIFALGGLGSLYRGQDGKSGSGGGAGGDGGIDSAYPGGRGGPGEIRMIWRELRIWDNDGAIVSEPPSRLNIKLGGCTYEDVRDGLCTPPYP